MDEKQYPEIAAHLWGIINDSVDLSFSEFMGVLGIDIINI